MKKLLIPILTTAAIAPVATSMVACSSTIKMKFEANWTPDEEKPGPAFVVENFKVQLGKKYRFSADISQTDKASYDHMKNNDILFLAGDYAQTKFWKMDKSKVKISRNGKDLPFGDESSGVYFMDDGYGFYINFKKVKVTKTDKFVFTIVWTKADNPTGVVGFSSE